MSKKVIILRRNIHATRTKMLYTLSFIGLSMFCFFMFYLSMMFPKSPAIMGWFLSFLLWSVVFMGFVLSWCGEFDYIPLDKDGKRLYVASIKKDILEEDGWVVQYEIRQ